jgi:hypothetical protein
MDETRGSRTPAPMEYYYRRELELRELLPALGVALGAGLAAFYIARLFIQRTPLGGRPGAGSARTPGVIRRQNAIGSARG